MFLFVLFLNYVYLISNIKISFIGDKIFTGKRRNRAVEREYQKSWEYDYFVTCFNDKAICLICKFVFTDKKKYNIERHCASKHYEISKNYQDINRRDLYQN